MDYKAIQSALVDRLGELTARAQRIEAHLGNRDRELPLDSSDRAITVEGDEVLELLDVRTRTEIVATREAIRRIAAGTFGRCIECGDPIEPGRLIALPTTPTCLVCAATSSEHA